MTTNTSLCYQFFVGRYVFRDGKLNFRENKDLR